MRIALFFVWLCNCCNLQYLCHLLNIHHFILYALSIICIRSLSHIDSVALVTYRWSGSSLMTQMMMARLRSRRRLQRTSWLCLMDVDKLSTDLCRTALRSVLHFAIIIAECLALIYSYHWSSDNMHYCLRFVFLPLNVAVQTVYDNFRHQISP